MIVPLRVLLVAVVLAPVLQAAPPGFVMWSSSELEQRDAALSTRVGQDHSRPRDSGRLRLPPRSLPLPIHLSGRRRIPGDT